MDEASRNHITVDHRTLSRELGVPVIPTSARQKEGMPELLEAVKEVATGSYKCHPHRIGDKSKTFHNTLNELVHKIEKQYPGLTNHRWVALRLLEGDPQIIEAVKTGQLSDLVDDNQLAPAV
jgi:ferrous iron transport protein B